MCGSLVLKFNSTRILKALYMALNSAKGFVNDGQVQNLEQPPVQRNTWYKY
jgi:hypothetical protein